MVKMPKPMVEKVLLDSYLAVTRNAVGSRMFRTFIARVDGRKQDILRKGELSCAFFASSVLALFKLIGSTHMTVAKTIADIEKSGWRKVRAPRPGSVLVWEAQDGHRHIGFFVGNQRAVSTSSRRGVVVRHHWTFGGKRNIEATYWHPKLG